MGLLDKVIARVLSTFFKDVNKRAVKINLLKGQCRLRNLQLKEELITSIIDLPIDIECASVGRIAISFPKINRIKVDPMIVSIDHVDLAVTENAEILQQQAREPRKKRKKRFLAGLFASKVKRGNKNKEDVIQKIMDGVKLEIDRMSFTMKMLTPTLQPGPTFVAEVKGISLVSTDHLWNLTDLRTARKINKKRPNSMIFKMVHVAGISVGYGKTWDDPPMPLLQTRASMKVALRRRKRLLTFTGAELGVFLDPIQMLVDYSDITAFGLVAGAVLRCANKLRESLNVDVASESAFESDVEEAEPEVSMAHTEHDSDSDEEDNDDPYSNMFSAMSSSPRDRGFGGGRRQAISGRQSEEEKRLSKLLSPRLKTKQKRGAVAAGQAHIAGNSFLAECDSEAKVGIFGDSSLMRVVMHVHVPVVTLEVAVNATHNELHLVRFEVERLRLRLLPQDIVTVQTAESVADSLVNTVMGLHLSIGHVSLLQQMITKEQGLAWKIQPREPSSYDYIFYTDSDPSRVYDISLDLETVFDGTLIPMLPLTSSDPLMGILFRPTGKRAEGATNRLLQVNLSGEVAPLRAHYQPGSVLELLDTLFPLFHPLVPVLAEMMQDGVFEKDGPPSAKVSPGEVVARITAMLCGARTLSLGFLCHGVQIFIDPVVSTIDHCPTESFVFLLDAIKLTSSDKMRTPGTTPDAPPPRQDWRTFVQELGAQLLETDCAHPATGGVHWESDPPLHPQDQLRHFVHASARNMALLRTSSKSSWARVVLCLYRAATLGYPPHFSSIVGPVDLSFGAFLRHVQRIDFEISFPETDFNISRVLVEYMLGPFLQYTSAVRAALDDKLSRITQLYGAGVLQAFAKPEPEHDSVLVNPIHRESVGETPAEPPRERAELPSVFGYVRCPLVRVRLLQNASRVSARRGRVNLRSLPVLAARLDRLQATFTLTEMRLLVKFGFSNIEVVSLNPFPKSYLLSCVGRGRFSHLSSKRSSAHISPAAIKAASAISHRHIATSFSSRFASSMERDHTRSTGSMRSKLSGYPMLVRDEHTRSQEEALGSPVLAPVVKRRDDAWPLTGRVDLVWAAEGAVRAGWHAAVREVLREHVFPQWPESEHSFQEAGGQVTVSALLKVRDLDFGIQPPVLAVLAEFFKVRQAQVERESEPLAFPSFLVHVSVARVGVSLPAGADGMKSEALSPSRRAVEVKADSASATVFSPLGAGKATGAAAADHHGVFCALRAGPLNGFFLDDDRNRMVSALERGLTFESAVAVRIGGWPEEFGFSLQHLSVSPEIRFTDLGESVFRPLMSSGLGAMKMISRIKGFDETEKAAPAPKEEPTERETPAPVKGSVDPYAAAEAAEMAVQQAAILERADQQLRFQIQRAAELERMLAAEMAARVRLQAEVTALRSFGENVPHSPVRRAAPRREEPDLSVFAFVRFLEGPDRNAWRYVETKIFQDEVLLVPLNAEPEVLCGVSTLAEAVALPLQDSVVSIVFSISESGDRQPGWPTAVAHLPRPDVESLCAYLERQGTGSDEAFRAHLIRKAGSVNAFFFMDPLQTVCFAVADISSTAVSCKALHDRISRGRGED